MKQKNSPKNKKVIGKVRALIIDDDESVREVIRSILETYGLKVAETSDGESGIEAFRSDPCQVVITDIIMVQKGGFEVIWDLKKEFPEVKIIAISGGGVINKQDVLEGAKRKGADFCLEKPFSAEDLLEALEKVGLKFKA